MAITATGPQVLVGGAWLPTIAPGWGDLKITNRWPFGNWEMSWTVPVRQLRRHQALVAGRSVVAFVGAHRRFSGFLSEPNWDTGEMIALGNVRRGEEAIALDGGGLTTTVPDTAIDAAIARGALPWVRTTSVGSAALGGSTTTDNLNYVSALLDAYTLQANTGWGVNARNEVYTLAAPTVPTLNILPDSGVFGVADQSLAGSVLGRYQTATGALATATAGTGAPEVAFSFLKRGVMTPTDATALAAGILAKLGTRTGWTNSLVLAAEQITTIGGARVNLSNVVANGRHMTRLLGVRDQRGLAPNTDTVIGETVWDPNDRTVQVSPVGLIDRSLQGIAEGEGVEVL